MELQNWCIYTTLRGDKKSMRACDANEGTEFGLVKVF